MATTKNKISLQTEFVFTLKTIFTVFITIGGILWGYHEWVLDKRLESLETDVQNVEQKIDKVYDHMVGIGSSSSLESANKPINNSDDNQGGL